MLGPVVYFPAQFIAIKKADIVQRSYERAFVPCPVHSQLDILVGQPFQVAIGPIGRAPQEQADEAPCAIATDSTD